MKENYFSHLTGSNPAQRGSCGAALKGQAVQSCLK
jgi:hypothetical protein